MTVSWLPYPGLPCITHLGRATAIGLDNDGERQEWITIHDRTGENFHWKPEEVRFPGNVTYSRQVSPLGRPAAETQVHIDRYKQNGWL